MTLLHRIRTRLHAAKISRLQQDIDWARISSDAHITELVRQRDALLDQMDPRSSDEIVRDVERSAKGVA